MCLIPSISSSVAKGVFGRELTAPRNGIESLTIRFLESSEWGEVYCSFLVWKMSWFVYLVIFNFFVSCRVYCRKHKKTAHNSEGTSFSYFLISRGNLSKINLVRGINEMVFHSFQLYDFYCPLTLNHCKMLHIEERWSYIHLIKIQSRKW